MQHLLLDGSGTKLCSQASGSHCVWKWLFYGFGGGTSGGSAFFVDTNTLVEDPNSTATPTANPREPLQRRLLPVRSPSRRQAAASCRASTASISFQ